MTGLTAETEMSVTDDVHNWTRKVPVCYAYAKLRKQGKTEKFKHHEYMAYKAFYMAELHQNLGEAWWNYLEPLKKIWKEVRPEVECFAEELRLEQQKRFEEASRRAIEMQIKEAENTEVE